MLLYRFSDAAVAGKLNFPAISLLHMLYVDHVLLYMLRAEKECLFFLCLSNDTYKDECVSVKINSLCVVFVERGSKKFPKTLSYQKISFNNVKSFKFLIEIK